MSVTWNVIQPGCYSNADAELSGHPCLQTGHLRYRGGRQLPTGSYPKPALPLTVSTGKPFLRVRRRFRVGKKAGTLHYACTYFPRMLTYISIYFSLSCEYFIHHKGY